MVNYVTAAMVSCGQVGLGLVGPGRAVMARLPTVRFGCVRLCRVLWCSVRQLWLGRARSVWVERVISSYGKVYFSLCVILKFSTEFLTL